MAFKIGDAVYMRGSLYEIIQCYKNLSTTEYACKIYGSKHLQFGILHRLIDEDELSLATDKHISRYITNKISGVGCPWIIK